MIFLCSLLLLSSTWNSWRFFWADWKHVGLDFIDTWSEQCQKSFEELKVKLTTALVLVYADFSQPFILEVDASHGELGANLSQEQECKV